MPANHKLLLVATRTAQHPRQQVHLLQILPLLCQFLTFLLLLCHLLLLLFCHLLLQIPRGKFVLFKFYVDGEALSEGHLHEATVKVVHMFNSIK